MKRKFMSLLSIIVLACMMTGCMRITGTIDTTKSKNKYIMTADVWFDKAKVDSYANGQGNLSSISADGIDTSMIAPAMTQLQSYPVVTVDGKEYYKADTQKTKSNYYPNDKNDSAIITRTSLYSKDASGAMDGINTGAEGAAEEYMSEFIEKVVIKAKFSDKIKKTNGKLSKNKKVVTFSYDAKDFASNKNTEMYAYTASSERTLAMDRAEFKKSTQNKN